MIVAEGWQGHVRTEGLTILDQTGTEPRAATVGRTGFYTPLTPGDGLHFGTETEVTVRGLEDSGRTGTACSIDWSRRPAPDPGLGDGPHPGLLLLAQERGAPRAHHLQSRGDGTVRPRTAWASMFASSGTPTRRANCTWPRTSAPAPRCRCPRRAGPSPTGDRSARAARSTRAPPGCSCSARASRRRTCWRNAITWRNWIPRRSWSRAAPRPVRSGPSLVLGILKEAD